MNIQQLRYLVAVSDLGSVSAAARSLLVTQPVVSRSVHAFEDEHGMTVFCLTGRRLVPTEAGRAVVEAAREALAAIDAVEQRARGAGGQAELVIATTPTNGLLLTSALSALRRSEPNLEIKVSRASDAEDVLRKVHRGEAEIGFSELNPLATDRRVTSRPIADLEVVLVSPIGSDLPAAVSWEDIVTLPLIMPPAGSGRRDLINKMAAAVTRTTPQISLVIEERGSWIAAAQAGMGSFLSYRCVVAVHLGIEIRPFKPPQIVTVGFVHRNRTISMAAKRLVELARSEYASARHPGRSRKRHSHGMESE